MAFADLHEGILELFSEMSGIGQLDLLLELSERERRRREKAVERARRCAAAPGGRARRAADARRRYADSAHIRDQARQRKRAWAALKRASDPEWVERKKKADAAWRERRRRGVQGST